MNDRQRKLHPEAIVEMHSRRHLRHRAVHELVRRIGDFLPILLQRAEVRELFSEGEMKALLDHAVGERRVIDRAQITRLKRTR
jgi:hypothetical protein